MRVHLEHLALNWSRSETPFERIVLMGQDPFDLDGLGTSARVDRVSFGSGLPPLVWEQIAFPRRARGMAAILSFYTCPLFFGGPMVVSNHGIYEAIPSTFSWWDRMRATPLNRWSARRAERVIANSLNTKADLERFFGVAEDKIDVIYEGPGDLFYQSYSPENIRKEVVEIFGQEIPYVLFVGKLATRRNVPNLIEAFSVVRKQAHLPHHLLIIGPNVNDLPLIELAERHGVARAIAHRPDMDHERLAKLYAGADVFALPTIYEGISRTIYEAMASGTAVLTVDHPTLSEGGGDAVLAVPTPSVQDLAQGLGALLTDQALRRRFEKKGGVRIQLFSMRECARQTMAVLDKAARVSDRSV